MEKNRRRIGMRRERQAGLFLESRGLVILEYNYRCRQGEIDMVAKDGRCYVFVEVKYRRGPCAGEALEAVNPSKQRVICRAALHYLTTKCHTVEVPCRFDVVGIDEEEIRWIPNAFDYQK